MQKKQNLQLKIKAGFDIKNPSSPLLIPQIFLCNFCAQLMPVQSRHSWLTIYLNVSAATDIKHMLTH